MFRTFIFILHTQQWTHTGSRGQPFTLQHPGSSWGFGALLKGTSVVVLSVERALYIQSPHLQYLLDRDSNSQPFDYESASLPLGHDFPKYIPQSNNKYMHIYIDMGKDWILDMGKDWILLKHAIYWV